MKDEGLNPSRRLTSARNLENGSAWSRAKAINWRDAVATLVMQQQIVKMIRMDVRTEAAAWDSVAMRKVWTIGITFGFDSIVSTSPRQKQNVTNIMNPREPLINTVHIIARGNVMELSLISSDMWVAESGPMKEKTGDSMPTRTDRPTLLQPPP